MEQNETCRFRSDFYHDLKLHKEFNRGIRDTRLFYRLVYLYIIGIFTWCFWYMMIQMDAPEIYANTAMIICGIWTLVEGIWFLATRGGGIHYKRSLMLNGGQPTSDAVLFCEDHIITLEKESGNKATILYDNIRAACETENLLLLAMRYGTYLMVDKRELSCSKDELGQFLYEKCPKLRHKKVRSNKWGMILRRTAWTVVAITFLIALYFHPVLQIDHRLKGQIHNGMKTTEIAAELETFGIGIHPQEHLDSLDEVWWSYLSNSKLENVLYRMGLGDRNFETGAYVPAQTGVCFTYYWSHFPENMYTDLLRGIDALCGDITIESISEDQSHADWENYDGYIAVDFILNGERQHLEAVFYEEWYDEQTFNALNTMIEKHTGKRLYFCDFDDIGCFIFYGDDTWAESFARRTGLELSSDINNIY